MSIRATFDAVAERAYQTRVNNLSGHAQWKEIEADIEANGPQLTFQVRTEHVLLVGEILKNDAIIGPAPSMKPFDFTLAGVRVLFADNETGGHFVAQLFRLPKKEGYEISYLTLMQLAWNMGMVKWFMDSAIYPQALHDYIVDHQLLNPEKIVEF